jgi:hypothetical protein
MSHVFLQWRTLTEDSSGIEDTVLLESWEEPPKDKVVAALNAAAERRREREGSSGSGWRLW